MKMRQSIRKVLCPFLSLTLTLALCLSIVPAPASAAGADFTIHNGYLEKYTGPGGDVVIPDSVTSIGAHAFQACHRLTSVALPSSITEISESAFSTCSRLTSVIIPEGITSIGDEAFAFCTSLTSVTVPSSVSAIGSRAFHTSDWANFDHIPIPGLTFSGAAGSYAERYAKEEGIPFAADPNGPIPASGTAYATPQTVLVDGKEVKFDTYALKSQDHPYNGWLALPL